ncbi:CDP-alcohol phosphatidyltransferase family protein [Patescibacteria group bacterium]|nr:CDP-alcohol phosphatidyltransferase family protein [Patescibacteria group bacterium]MBU1702910.1 CDP-alcohol phosphatidyltransferase family protein [Patescibacteria group bacterium]MBU1954415.1 CDP-alcohol phosphatidyltransferase family protein [Patescibacteria group bacterium]
MMNYKKAGHFSEDEQKYYLWYRNAKDGILLPISRFLAARHVTPNTLSYMGLLMMPFFVYCFAYNPWIAFFFLIINLLFDALDGSVARVMKKESAKGEFTDKAVDYASFAVVYFTFLYFGLFSPFWAAVLLLNYAIMQSLIIFGQMMEVKLFPILRPKMIIYLFFLVWLISGQNLFDPLLVVLSVYLLVSNYFLIAKIRCSL